MKIGLITPSYNKPEYILDTIVSITNQSYDDWVYTIYENSTDNVTRDIIKNYINTCPQNIKNKIVYFEKDFTQEERTNNYVPSLIVNEFYKYAKGVDLLFYISDDDYLVPRAFKILVDFFKKNPDKKLIYFKLGLLHQKGSEFIHAGELPAMNTFGQTFSLQRTPVDYLDGGQIIFKKEILDKIPYPYFEEKLIQGVSNHCDGLFLEKLANVFTIPPVEGCNDSLGYHRITTKSTWRKA